MTARIVIRRARAEDETAREALRRSALKGIFLKACKLLFFKKLTIGLMLIIWIVLFFDLKVSLIACTLNVPAVTAIIIMVIVYFSNESLADVHLSRKTKEWEGLVAESIGLAEGEPPPLNPTIQYCNEANLPALEAEPNRQMVATLSITDFVHPRPIYPYIYQTSLSGYIHSLVVKEGWRRLGVASALSTASILTADGGGLRSLEVYVSELHPEGHELFTNLRWPLRKSTSRWMLGPAATVKMDHFGVDFEIFTLNDLLSTPISDEQE